MNRKSEPRQNRAMIISGKVLFIELPGFIRRTTDLCQSLNAGTNLHKVQADKGK
jgi:hypothetical protein